MTVCSIYKIHNKINQKNYIGFASRDPDKRFLEHITGKGSYISYAIKEYGVSKFDFDVIYQTKDEDHALNEMENYFIEFYNSVDFGYNQNKGMLAKEVLDASENELEIDDCDILMVSNKQKSESELFSDRVAEVLKQERKKRDMSHDTLADLCGLTRPAISHIEAGKRRPSLENVYKIVTAMDMTMLEFFKLIEKRS